MSALHDTANDSAKDGRYRSTVIIRSREQIKSIGTQAGLYQDLWSEKGKEHKQGNLTLH